MLEKKYTFIDLFAGCGGLSEGFLQTNRYESIAHVEWEKPMVETLRNRLIQKWGRSQDEAHKEVIQFDIQRTDELINGNWSEESQKIYGSFNHLSIAKGGLRYLVGKRHVNMIIGGPPCQAYSIHGRATDQNSMQDDYRNYLFESFCKVVEYFKPDVFVFENVKGLLSARPGGTFVKNRIFNAFSEIGYEMLSPEELNSAVFDANDFNVPQTRPRVIIVGIRRDSKLPLDEFYKAIAAEKSSKKLTVKDGIGMLPGLYPLKSQIKEGRQVRSHTLNPDKSVTLHDARNHNHRDRKVFRDWVSNNMNYVSKQEMLDYYFEITGHETLFQKYKSLEWDKPAHTIVAHLSKDGYMFIHPDVNQERSITVREAACLQSFPLDFQFMGSRPYNYKMIGNAVPVSFALSIATGLYKTLDKNLK